MMDSRLIFEANKTYQYKIVWTKLIPDSDSEWITYNIEDSKSRENIKEIIELIFKSDILYVSIDRKNSFSSDKETIFDRIKNHLQKEIFFVWSSDFKVVMEFNKIGIFRFGSTSS